MAPMNRILKISIFTFVCFAFYCTECVSKVTEVDLGWDSYRKGDYQAAEANYFDALENNTSQKGAVVERLAILYAHMKINPTEVIQRLQKCKVEIVPSHVLQAMILSYGKLDKKSLEIRQYLGLPEPPSNENIPIAEPRQFAAVKKAVVQSKSNFNEIKGAINSDPWAGYKSAIVTNRHVAASPEEVYAAEKVYTELYRRRVAFGWEPVYGYRRRGAYPQPFETAAQEIHQKYDLDLKSIERVLSSGSQILELSNGWLVSTPESNDFTSWVGNEVVFDKHPYLRPPTFVIIRKLERPESSPRIEAKLIYGHQV